MSVNTQQLEDKIELMKTYLKMKFDEGDWHGVADAAMDIRELNAELRAIRRTNEGHRSSQTRNNDSEH